MAEPLDSVNPTGGVFVGYTPEKRATAPLAENIVTLAETSGKNPDETIVIYRGATINQKEIVPGDFITTNKQLAKDYAGSGKVIEKKVRLGDILDDKDEPLGEEYIYRPSMLSNTPAILDKKTVSRLKELGWEEELINSFNQEEIDSIIRHNQKPVLFQSIEKPRRAARRKIRKEKVATKISAVR